MIGFFANSTRSISGKLALFFTLVSVCNCVIIYLFFFSVLKWAQDEEGHKHILLDAQTAIERYNSGETGPLKLDVLTTSYDDIAQVPERYREVIQHKSTLFERVSDLFNGIHRKNSLIPSEFEQLLHGDPIFLGRIEVDEHTARMVYANTFHVEDSEKVLILVTKIDEIELTSFEYMFLFIALAGIFALLLTAFLLILIRLSKRLISPVNHISEQLERYKGSPDAAFKISHEAAIEFTQLTEQLNHYREEANALITREQIFARYASHEMRTPLSIVEGANELLQSRCDDDFQHRQLNRIQRATSQMSAMTDALLALVRYERSDKKETLRLLTETELQDIVSELEGSSNNSEIKMQIKVTGEPEITAVPEVTNMIINNLLRNAISASEKGVIEVSMDKTSLSIADEGSGLCEQPFEGGHGLGLALVKDFCLRYGWQFSLSNRPVKGCIARIDFSQL